MCLISSSFYNTRTFRKILNIVALFLRKWLVIYVSVQAADFKGVVEGLSRYQYIIFLVFLLENFQGLHAE